MDLGNKTRTPNVTKCLVIYSKKTGAFRRIIDEDHDDNYEWHEKTRHPGEGFFYLTHKEVEDIPSNDHAALTDIVAKKAGFKEAPRPLTLRHAHLNEKNVVVNTIMADPSCGDHGEHFGPGHSLVQHDTAEVGHTYSNGVFTSSDVPHTHLTAYVERNPEYEIVPVSKVSKDLPMYIKRNQKY